MHEPGTWLNAIEALLPEWAHSFITVNVLTGWLVAAVLVLLLWRATRNLQIVPRSGWQTLAELFWAYMVSFSEDIIGPGGARFAPFLATLFLYILLMNVFGLIPGFLSPTANLSMTGALAFVTVAAVQYFGFREHGWRYLRHFFGEVLWLAPLMVIIHGIGEVARILSLAIRLFGNIFGEDTLIAQLIVISVLVMGVIYIPIPLQLPIVLLHILISIIQAFIFTMLAASYIAGAVEEPAH